MQSVLIMYALYVKYPYYVVFYMQSVHIMQCFIFIVPDHVMLCYTNCPFLAVLYII